MLKIDYENLFFQNLDSGMNFFTGAGFSVLPNPDGEKLPTVKDLIPEINKEFNINYGDDIEIISEILSKQYRKEYQSFLRKRFTVETYNPLYDVLDDIDIKGYITTNIDNIFQLVLSNGNNHYVHNVAQYGEGGRKGESIEYIPLHGDCLDPESYLYFGKFELGNAPRQNEALFRTAYSYIQRYPTVIVGYGLHDSGVISYLSSLLHDKRQDIWIQCMPKSENINAYKNLGFSIIEGDTESFLARLKEHVTDRLGYVPVAESAPEDIDKTWRKHCIPDLQSVKESVTKEDYYLLGETSWNNIITGKAFELDAVRLLLDGSAEHKNVIMTGIPLSGKTTLLMQCARKMHPGDSDGIYYFEELSESEANYLCKKMKGKATVFLDNCARDMKAYLIFAKHPNIRLIGAANEYEFEASKHILTEVDCYHFAMEDISEREARSMYQFIPDSFLKPEFKYARSSEDRYGILEFYSDNVDGVIGADRVKKFLENISDDEVLDIIFLTAYMNENGSFLNIDVLLQYTGSNYEDVRKLIDKTNRLLAEMDERLHVDMEDQDYYRLRSHLFVYNVQRVAVQYFKAQYAKVVRKFISEVSPGSIYHNYIFKRKAYDASFFKVLYGEDALELYDQIYNHDGSAYTLQQRALYKAKCEDFSSAFSDIDDAAVIAPKNFSIRNTKAVILFEANRESGSESSRRVREQSMSILEKCYKSDKRKVYHAQKYAEYALEIAKKWNDDRYIDLAKKWINTLIKDGDSCSNKTKRLKARLDKWGAC